MVKFSTINKQTVCLKSRYYKTQPKLKQTPAQEFKTKLIKEIVKKSLIELAVSLAFTVATCFFVATPIGMATLFICAIAAIAINILLRSIGAFSLYNLFLLKHNNSTSAQEKKQLYNNLYIYQFFAPLTFSLLVDSQTRSLLVHEGGHALATKILVKNPRPHITINPGEGGVTSYRLGALTKIGEFFGRANAKLIIAGAGTALSITTATLGLATSFALRKTNPELSRYLNIMAIDSVAEHVFYALSALWTATTQKGHDFIQLMAGGVHPVVSVVAIVALPLIVRIGFLIYDRVKESAEQKEAQRLRFANLKTYLLPQKV